MRTLQEADVIRIMREEFDRRLAALTEEIDVTMTTKVDGQDKPALSPELKVMHKTSGIRYTVDSVGPRDVILRTPEGEKFLVDQGELEQEYELS